MLFTTIMGLGGLSMDIFRNSLKAELYHLVKINFFAAFSISLLGTLLASLAGLARLCLRWRGCLWRALCFCVLLARLKAWLKVQLLKLKSRIPKKFI